MGRTPMREMLRLLGALSGAVFAVLAAAAYSINTGPPSSDGLTVVNYYSAHGTETLSEAVLVGVAAMCLLWFAETFAGCMRAGPVGVAGAAATTALYLVAVGSWTILGDIYGGVDIADVPSDGYSNAHTLYVVGVGASHMGNFPAAAFVASTAAAMLASGAPWRLLGWLGVAVTVVRLGSALVELASESHWSDLVSIGGFLVFLAWVFVVSTTLLVKMRRTTESTTDPSSLDRQAPEVILAEKVGS